MAPGRIHRLIGTTAALAVGAALLLPLGPPAVAAPAAPTGPAAPSMGINPTGIADWGTAWPFVDAFRSSRNWISQQPGATWGKGPALDLDDRGWVRRLEPGKWADTPVMLEATRMPKGRYVVTWEGDGDVGVWSGDPRTKPLNLTANRFEFDLGTSGVFLRLARTNPANHVRDIHVWMPGYEKTGAKQVFHPVFLERLKGFRTLRFMDWIYTNAPNRFDTSSLAAGPRPDSATQANGVAPELMVELANRVGADAWFNVPHLAGDRYVREFATLVRDTLAPGRKAYIEYSNETWNGGFPSAKYVQDEGVRLGLSSNRYQAGLFYHAKRAVEIFQIWRDVFGEQGGTRLVRVLAAQSANPWTGEQVLAWNDAYKQADAIAIAPYFHCTGQYVANDPKYYAPGYPGVTTAVKAAGLTRLVSNCQHDIDNTIREQITGYRLLAERYGVALVGYEGGQHLAGVYGTENDEQLTALFHAANRDPRMRQLYTNFYNVWVNNGGGMMATFSATAAPSKWGTFGLLEYQDQPVAKAPKFQATLEFMTGLRARPVREIVPYVTGLSVRTATKLGGTEVVISGNRLASATSVTVGGTAAKFRKVVDAGVTRLVAVVPAHAPGLVDVVVSGPAGGSLCGSATKFTYTGPPVITRLSATKIPAKGGTVVTVTGTSFTGMQSVTLGGAAATSVQVLSDTQLRFVAPARSVGTVNVVLRTPYGTSTASPGSRLAVG